MKLICFFIVSSSLTLSLLGCTGSGSGSFSSAPESSKELGPKEAQKQIETIQSKINSDSRYTLTSDEVTFLSEQGVVSNEFELKGWVK